MGMGKRFKIFSMDFVISSLVSCFVVNSRVVILVSTSSTLPFHTPSGQLHPSLQHLLREKIVVRTRMAAELSFCRDLKRRPSFDHFSPTTKYKKWNIVVWRRKNYDPSVNSRIWCKSKRKTCMCIYVMETFVLRLLTLLRKEECLYENMVFWKCYGRIDRVYLNWKRLRQQISWYIYNTNICISTSKHPYVILQQNK